MAAACEAELIAVGSEILLGQIHNRHAQYISEEFAKHGLYVYYHTAVGDNFERIVESFRIASQRANVVIVTGGLGPTVDDLTKEALADYLGRNLIMDENALREVEAYFAKRQRPMPESNRKQALCIEGGRLLANPNGTAPGQYVEQEGIHYFLLPGPPLEMHPMLLTEVIPTLERLFGNQKVVRSRVLHFCGIGESDVDAQVRDLTATSNPTVAPLAGEGEMLLRITASAANESSAWSKIAPVEAEIRRRLGGYIYGVDEENLQSAVVNRLHNSGLTLAVAESCTGGLVQSMLTQLPGVSSVYRGGVVAYHNEIKNKILHVSSQVLLQHGAVSRETAIAMAQGVKDALDADWGLSVTGIAGPSGGSDEKPVGTVYIGVAGLDGVSEVYSLHLRGSREQIQIRSAKHALWRLWQHLHS